MNLPMKCGRLRARINEVTVLKFILLDCFWKLWAWMVPSTCSIPIKESSGESHEELRRNVVVSNSIGVPPWYDMNRSFGSWLWKRSSWIFFCRACYFIPYDVIWLLDCIFRRIAALNLSRKQRIPGKIGNAIPHIKQGHYYIRPKYDVDAKSTIFLVFVITMEFRFPCRKGSWFPCREGSSFPCWRDSSFLCWKGSWFSRKDSL